MKVDLLVVSYNTSSLLRRLVETLHSDFEPDVWDLHIMDNGSNDGTREYLTSLQANTAYSIKSLSFGPNVGYSRAVNHMAARSENEILAAVNGDVWFTTKHVKQIIESFDAHPEMAICGPKQMNERREIKHGGIFWTGPDEPHPIHRGWNMSDPQDAKLKDRAKCWTVSGSLYYVRRDVWNILTECEQYQQITEGLAEGTFLPTPHFFEETYCSVHAQHHGYEVWYDGTVETAGHTWHASSPVGSVSDKYFDVSRDIYIEACNRHGIAHECE